MTVGMKPTWDQARLKRDRLHGIQTRMKEQGVGALYMNDGYYLRYVLNLKVPGAGVFVPVEGEAIAFIRPRDTGYVKSRHDNVRPVIFHRSEVRDGSDPEEADRF